MYGVHAKILNACKILNVDNSDYGYLTITLLKLVYGYTIEFN